MHNPLHLALLLSVALAVPAAAQNAAQTPVAGTNLANPFGAVNLPATGTASSTTASGSGTSTTGASSGGGFGAASTGSSGAAAVTSSGQSGSGQSGSGGSSGAGAPAGSGAVPAWLLCPPSGSSGLAPFMTGTNLSCAPEPQCRGGGTRGSRLVLAAEGMIEDRPLLRRQRLVERLDRWLGGLQTLQAGR